MNFDSQAALKVFVVGKQLICARDHRDVIDSTHAQHPAWLVLCLSMEVKGPLSAYIPVVLLYFRTQMNNSRKERLVGRRMYHILVTTDFS